MLKLQDVHSGYGEIKVLKGVSLEVGDSEIVALVGTNAAGKSTLINTISAQLTVTSGSIQWDGQELTKKAWEVVNSGIIQVPEGRKLFPFMSVKENLEVGAYSKRAREKKAQTIEMVYALFPDLPGREKQMAGTLSGGQQQMVAIGRGLMSCPRLLMLDEPSLGLAPIIVKQIFDIIKDINGQGMSILLAEQNVKQSLKLADRAYVIEQGRIVMNGTGQELLNDERVKVAYLGM